MPTLMALGLVACWSAAEPELPPPEPAVEVHRPGRRGKARRPRGGVTVSERQQELIEQLEAIGYVGEGDVPLAEQTGVTVHDEAAYAGVNLVVSAHAPGASLMTMDGDVVHTWSLGFDQVFPGDRAEENHKGSLHWRRVALADEGHVVVIFEGLGIMRVNAESELVWAVRNEAHHDLEIRGSEVWTLTREAKMIPRLNAEEPILEDFISVLDLQTGREKRRFSVLEAFEKHPEFDTLFSRKENKKGLDIFHTNSIETLGTDLERHGSAFRAGNLLLSMRTIDTIAVLDPDQQAIVWAWTGAFSRQHDPTALSNGNLLVFNNNSDRGFSTVAEVDPSQRQVVWQVHGKRDLPLYSKLCGTAQRLPNGNTLITESGSGRAFEVTRDKRVVWEWKNPHPASHKPKLVARIFDLVRLPPSTDLSWLE